LILVQPQTVTDLTTVTMIMALLGVLWPPVSLASTHHEY